MNEYNHEFYKNRSRDTSYSAKTILTLVQKVLPKFDSITDYGCGVGAWLAAANKLGATKIKGYDGQWVDKALLAIPLECFSIQDFEKPYANQEKCDLCISLEVAEHVSGKNADKFINALTSTSDYILFSAAIPGQGGNHHINEQWPTYWIQLFANNDYECMDIIRPRIWDDDKIPYWYRQNCMLFIAKNLTSTLKPHNLKTNFNGASLVHPVTFEKETSRLKKISIYRSLAMLVRAIFRLFPNKAI